LVLHGAAAIRVEDSGRKQVATVKDGWIESASSRRQSMHELFGAEFVDGVLETWSLRPT
jgi:hypothetical protein